MEPRIYTYRIKFIGTPYFYWGVHKEKKYGERYFGSPCTNKWAWNFYEFEKEILEIFPLTKEGWSEATEVEVRLIKPDLNNPWCLNAACGRVMSLETLSRLIREGRGIFTKDAEYLKQRNTKNAAKRTKEGLARGGSAALKLRIEKDPDYQSKTGKKGGPKGGARSKELGVGICGIPTEERRQRGKEVAAQRWKCLVTGHVSAAGPLTLWQKARSIDTSLRERLL